MHPSLWRGSLLRWAEGKAPEGACDLDKGTGDCIQARLGGTRLCMRPSLSQ